jgi:S1-C subfamily serine protease
MRRVTLYSSARRPGWPGRPAPGGRHLGGPDPARGAPPAPSAARRSRASWRSWRVPAWSRGIFLAGVGGLAVLLVLAWHGALLPPARRITQQDIDAAVLHALTTRALPSRAVKAVESVRPSVVRVQGWGDDEGAKKGSAIGVGTGVVILDKGIILTNLHVVSGALRVVVTFADGTESEAAVVSVEPDRDLAVLQAKTLPDDLLPATLRTTEGLAPGDEVVAVGFPFGIGPSASAGVISGLGREFHSPQGKRLLTNLIQFDAAANPGNSGGPLVTMDGEVVGIVTGILNPTDQRVFIGIGFAVPIESAAAAVGLPPF